ncbi:helix-turn-helix domain-containing protein [Baekduia sp. Peel2402]|uniref:helix-turn-helix domain-containing protein n=1 Tax=Baekduia sp. Peel2402 TaxID=3458296 RepID=UPI00403E4DD9
MALDFTPPDAAGAAAAQCFARNLRRRRRALGWSQEKAAERAHLNMSYWSRIERGQVTPGIRMAARMAHAVGTTLSALVAEDSAPVGPDLTVLVRRLRQVASAAAFADAAASALLAEVQEDAGLSAEPPAVGPTDPVS